MTTATAKRRETAPEQPTQDGSRVVLSRYRLKQPLGSGGFGTVWLAHDEKLRRDVAVKRIPREGTDQQRAAREAVASARLSHPAIVTLYEAGSDADSLYLVSELVAGETLDTLTREGQLADRDVVEIGVAVARALEHAHRRGVVHRDVKPQNILIPERPIEAAGVAKLADFGIARLLDTSGLTQTGDVLGTLAYMSPEQADGRPAGPASDLYSLALSIYEGLTGRNPVRASGAAATARKVGQQIPSLGKARPDLPTELVTTIDQALLADQEQRGSLRDFANSLELAVDGLSAQPPLGEPRKRAAVNVGFSLPTWGARLGAGLLLGGTVAAGAQIASAHQVGLPPLLIGLLIGVAGAIAPRIAWLAALFGAAIWLSLPANDAGGVAAVLVLAAVPIPLLLARHGRMWCVPVLAPLLGAVSLAGAYPALLGRVRSLPARAALGACGYWLLLIVQATLDRVLYLGPPVGIPDVASWHGSARTATELVVVPNVTTGLVAGAIIWAVAAAILPLIVRGRSIALDLVAAVAWAAGTLAGVEAVGTALGDSVATPQAAGGLIGATVAVVVAVGAALLQVREPDAA